MLLGSFIGPKSVLRHKLDPRIGGVWEILGICFLCLSPLLHFVYLLHPLLSLQTSISSYFLHQVESGPDRVTDIMYMGSGIGETQILFWSHLNCKRRIRKSCWSQVSTPSLCLPALPSVYLMHWWGGGDRYSLGTYSKPGLEEGALTREVGSVWAGRPTPTFLKRFGLRFTL